MSLQLILGGSGYGKSFKMYKEMVRLSEKYPKQRFLCIVPEQFTMEMQKTIVNLSVNKGTMNVDILSFDRLAKRIFEEAGISTIKVLDDTGKCLILRKIIEENKKNLTVFGSKAKMSGFINEMKSLVSELFQYGINETKLEEILKTTTNKPLLYAKFQDILLIVKKLKEYLEDRFILNEELLSRACDLIENSNIIRNSYITLDEYTGFSPIQYQLIGQLLKFSNKVNIAITIRDAEKTFYYNIKEQDIFALPKKTINKLKSLSIDTGVEILEDIILEENHRHKDSLALKYLEKNIFRYGSKKSTNKDGLEINMCNNTNSEVFYVAATIQKLIYNEEKIRYKDIAVVCSDMEGYHQELEECFKKCNIPYFIDYKRSIITNPCVEAIRAIIEVIEKNYDYESVFRYLRSSMSSLNREEIDELENYILRYGIRGYKKWSKEFIYFGASHNLGEEESKIYLGRINSIREKVVEDTREIYNVFAGKEKASLTVKKAIEALYRFTVKLNMENKINTLSNKFLEMGDLSLAKEYSQTYGKVVELFDKTVFLIGDEGTSAKELGDILDSGFEEIKVGVVPQGIDRVAIGDIERSRLKDIKVLFLVGVNDGMIPRSAVKGGVLSVSERNFLSDNQIELSPTDRENAFIQKYYLYLILTKMSSKLYVSYKLVNSDGSSTRQSYLINTIFGLFEDFIINNQESETRKNSIDNIINTKTAKSYLADNIYDYLSYFDNLSSTQRDVLFRELFLELKLRGIDFDNIIDAAYFKLKNTKLDTAVSRAIYGEQIYNSVSRLETFAACAYKHFIMYGLNLVKRKTYEIESTDIGTLYHSALEKFTKQLIKEKISWSDITEELSDKIVSQCISEIVNDNKYNVIKDNARNEYLLERIEKITKKTVWALSKQQKLGKFVSENVEFKFSSAVIDKLGYKYQDGTSMGIKGVIDRVDYYYNGDDIFIKIVDYKSGRKKFEINDVYNGLQLQLVLYMEAAMEEAKKKHPKKNIIPGGIFYYNIDDPLIDITEVSSEDNISEEIKEKLIKDKVDMDTIKKLKVNGLVQGRMDNISAMDSTISEGEKSVISNVIPVALDKTGNFTKKSSIASENDFKELISYVHNKIGAIGNNILCGDVDINPYTKLKGNGERGVDNPCKYCEYSTICGFDTKIPGYNYRNIENIQKEEIWKKIAEENKLFKEDI